MNNAAADAPQDSGATVELIVYTTQRRLRTNGILNDNAPWRYHCPLLIGTELGGDGVLSPVCYYEDIDISDIIVQHGRGPVDIDKLQGDPENFEMDYRFSIRLGGTGDNDLHFRGVLTDREGEWDWRGRYAGRRAQLRGRPAAEIYGPDGRSTLQELLSFPSMSVQGTTSAQEEASRILERLINASIPQDVQQTLNLNIPALSDEEEKIRQFAPDFLPRAAVVTLFKQWHKSEHVDGKQRSRINTNRCDQFYPLCTAYSAPTDSIDPVSEFGWDRVKDADIIEKVQAQYGLISLACYRLGYRRKVTRLRPFLSHPAYWYKRLSEYLVSPIHCARFSMRVSVRDSRVEPDIHDWCTHLALLKEAAGDNIEDAPKIETVLHTLQGIALMSSISETELDDSFIARLEELFTQIENLMVDSEEYIQLNKDLTMRKALIQGGSRRSLIQFIQNYRLACGRTPSIGETIKAFYQSSTTKSPDSNAPLVGSSRCLGLPPRAASILVGIAMVSLLNDLLTKEKKLSLSEKITICLSLAPTIITSTRDLAEGIGSYFSKFLPNRLGKSLSTRCTAVFNRAGQLWSKVEMSFSYALGVVVAGFCVWSAFDRFQKAWNNGEIIDKWAAGCDLMLSALLFVVTTGKAIALACGASATLVACFGLLGGGTVITAIVSSLLFAAIKWQQNKDPVAPFITKYGNMYGLLKA
ncbi:unnamed protein product [Rhizoctonia solani]|uniref:Uncharacterized protein n=1 Tax=Rhizoctonia solani TaxID=456999 RepID=A0A8H2W837_9AGAM|nr:unnamed protein product [Rhizoctonia solani]